MVKGRKIDATVRSGPWRDRLENVFGWDPTAGKPKPGVHLYKLTRKYLQTPVDKVMHALAVEADVADPKWQRLLQLEQEQCEALMQKLSDLRPEQREEFLQDLSTAGEDDLVLTLDYVEVTREAEDHSDA